MLALRSAVRVGASAELLRLLRAHLAEVVRAVVALVVLRHIVFEVLERAKREIFVEGIAIFIVACETNDLLKIIAIAVVEVKRSGTSRWTFSSWHEWRVVA